MPVFSMEVARIRPTSTTVNWAPVAIIRMVSPALILPSMTRTYTITPR